MYPFSLDPSWLPFLLRTIDGYAGVVGSPVVVSFANRLGPPMGIEPRSLQLFAGSIGAYGVVTLAGLRHGRVPGWLAATGIAVNVGVFITATRSLTSNARLTALGRLSHVGFLMATAMVTFGLAGSAYTYYYD